MIDASEIIQTKRLSLRKPEMEDAQAIFDVYASDTRIGEYIAWPIHRTLDDTLQFLEFSDSEWARWPAGPYLIFSRDGALLGSTGLAFESSTVASTGYVLAVDAWGHGFATEAACAMKDLAKQLGVTRFYAYCHTDHDPSANVLLKCGLKPEGLKNNHAVFPNSKLGVAQDVLQFSCDLSQ